MVSQVEGPRDPSQQQHGGRKVLTLMEVEVRMRKRQKERRHLRQGALFRGNTFSDSSPTRPPLIVPHSTAHSWASIHGCSHRPPPSNHHPSVYSERTSFAGILMQTIAKAQAFSKLSLYLSFHFAFTIF